MWVLTSLGPETENCSKVTSYISSSSLSLSPIITRWKSPLSGLINLYVLDLARLAPVPLGIPPQVPMVALRVGKNCPIAPFVSAH